MNADDQQWRVTVGTYDGWVVTAIVIARTAADACVVLGDHVRKQIRGDEVGGRLQGVVQRAEAHRIPERNLFEFTAAERERG